MNTTRLYITGYGLITPIGHGAWPTFRALLAGSNIATRAAALTEAVSAHDVASAAGGVAIVQHANLDPAIDLAELAAREAMVDAGQGTTPAPMILGTSKGAMHAMCRAAVRPSDKNAAAVTMGPHGYLAHHLSHRMGAPVIQSYAAACASSLTALHHARCAIISGRVDRVLVVSAEAALLPIFVSSYHRLGVLACPTPQGYRGLPLDVNRGGFMLAEMGAAVLIEKRPTPHAIELVDTAIAAEANDMVRPSPDMASLHHIASQLLDKRDIDLLHPHATGTIEHDPIELDVYKRCDVNINDIYACKGAIGHGLGTAGLASLVIACMCARANQRPPMPWLKDPIDANIKAVAPANMPLRTQAIFAAGFAGHVAGAVLRSLTD